MPVEEERWEGWLAQHGPALVLFAGGWTACRADAEDAVQEAFVRFWRSRDRAHDPLAYLYACVKRAALERLRGEARRKRREAAAAALESQEPWFADPLEGQERRAAIEAALAQLPAEQREVLVLKLWGELTFAQIAEALGVPANTAASRYRYALARLRAQLAEETIR
ncbi:MAG: sigma-70 family RNA polymerase sigma factor [Pirellulales bacterium]